LFRHYEESYAMHSHKTMDKTPNSTSKQGRKNKDQSAKPLPLCCICITANRTMRNWNYELLPVQSAL